MLLTHWFTIPNKLTATASATDPEGTALTYTWSATTTENVDTGSFSNGGVGNSITWTPPADITSQTIITLKVEVTDGIATVSTTRDIVVYPAIPSITFTNLLDNQDIRVAENVIAVNADGYFAATATGTTTPSLVLSGQNSDLFTLSNSGTLTFNSPPNYETTVGDIVVEDKAKSYSLRITATVLGYSVSTAFTVSVTDVNEAPVIGAPTVVGFVEHTVKTITIAASDVDEGQTLTYTLAPNAFGATIHAVSGAFSWTPREEDGGQEREFTVTVTDSATPALTDTVTFTITPTEVGNRPPTGATIASTPNSGVTRITNPSTLTVTATATDPDKRPY